MRKVWSTVEDFSFSMLECTDISSLDAFLHEATSVPENQEAFEAMATLMNFSQTQVSPFQLSEIAAAEALVILAFAGDTEAENTQKVEAAETLMALCGQV
jgi:hypothetical protein